MSRNYLYFLSAFVLGFVSFYFSPTKNRHEAGSLELMSKKLQSNAKEIISDSDDGTRAPANAAALEQDKGSQERWISKIFKGASVESTHTDFSERNIRDRERERRMALQQLRSSGSKIGNDGIGVLPKLKAIPREKLQSESEEFARAKVVDSHWAIYEQSQMPNGNPVVYDFNNDRWGVMTGMLELAVEGEQNFKDTVTGLESQGYKVIKTENSTDTVYVATGSTALEKINKVSEELKSQFGSKAVKAETIFVWRSAQ
jgi:hypothetical protein